MSGAAGAAPSGAASSWSPFRIAIFRAVWLASLASNLGSWMHLVAASWLMTSLTDSAALVALLATAAAVPSFALAMPAGALADVLDRRSMVLFAQAWQLAVAGILGAVTVTGAMTPPLLLALTFALGIGATLGLPAFSAMTSELVPREELPAAISLNSAGLTLSQTLGPALGGVLVASLGPGAVFAINAASFLGVVAAVASWRRSRAAGGLPAEHVRSAIRTGLGYVAAAPEFRAVLVRAAAFVLCFSALPALLAVVVRTRLDGSAADYGLLQGLLGAGGVAGALLLPRLRRKVPTEYLVAAATVAYGGALAALGFATSLPLAGAVLAFAGLAGMAVMSSMNLAAMSVLPDWVRGRGLSVLQLVFQAGIAGGAAFWGAAAGRLGVPAALALAGAGLAAGALLAFRFRLSDAANVDVRPAEEVGAYLPEPHTPAIRVYPDDGPVMVSVDYRIPFASQRGFFDAVCDLGNVRRRSGGLRWGVFVDLEDPERVVESYLVASFAEHERGRERLTVTDGRAIERVHSFHAGVGDPPTRYALGHDFRRPARLAGPVPMGDLRSNGSRDTTVAGRTGGEKGGSG